MSLTCMAYIIIKNKISEEVITKILQNALAKGFYFFDDSNPIKLQRISLENIRDKFLHPKLEELEDGGPYIDAILYDGRFGFKIIEYDNQLHIFLDPELELWVKEIDKETCLDFGRYANILLEISQPYEIQSIELETF